MNDRDFRLECIKIAVEAARMLPDGRESSRPEAVLETAKKYYEWVWGAAQLERPGHEQVRLADTAKAYQMHCFGF